MRICLSCCGFSGESDYLVTVDCGNFFSTVKGVEIPDECQDDFYDELYDGAMLEMDNFIRLFIHELAETLGEKDMNKTNTNGLSANSQQAKFLLH